MISCTTWVRMNLLNSLDILNRNCLLILPIACLTNRIPGLHLICPICLIALIGVTPLIYLIKTLMIRCFCVPTVVWCAGLRVWMGPRMVRRPPSWRVGHVPGLSWGAIPTTWLIHLSIRGSRIKILKKKNLEVGNKI